MRHILSLITFLLAGCVNPPIHYAKPSKTYLEIPRNWSIEQEIEDKEKRSLPDLLQSPQMKNWLTTIIDNSSELKISALEQAQREITINQNKSYRQPEISFNASANRAKNITFGKNYQNSFQLGAQVSWELDLWGRIGSQAEAAQLGHRISQLQEIALTRSLIAQALKSQVNMSSMAIQQELISKSTMLLKDEILRAEQQARMGEIVASELEAVRINHEQSHSQLMESQRKLSDAKISVQRLTGSFEAVMENNDGLVDLALPNVSVSSKYLLNRPDVRMAFVNISRSDVMSDIAYRSLFPSFSLTLDSTKTASTARDLLKADPVWSLLGQLIQPVFNSGRMEAEVKRAELSAQKALIEYQQTLKNAYFEVEVLSNNERHLTQQVNSLITAHSANKRRYATAMHQYEIGLLQHEQWVSVKHGMYEVERNLRALEAVRAMNRIDLFLALGLPLLTQS